MWYQQPLLPRVRASLAFDDHPVMALRLPARAQHVLTRSPEYCFIGPLMRADEAIASLRNLGALSLSQIHAALAPYFDAAAAAPAPSTGIAAASGAAPPLASALADLASMPPFETAPWYIGLHAQRIEVARAFRAAPVAVLGLSASAWRDLAPDGQATLARLIAAPVAIAGTVNAATRRELHERIRLFARRLLLDMNRLQADLRALAGRPDLAGLELASLPWPPALTAALSGPERTTLGALAHCDPAMLVAQTLVADLDATALSRRLRLLLAAPGLTAAKDLARLCDADGNLLLPAGYGLPGGPSLRDAVHCLLRDWALAHRELDWDILGHRYGLMGLPRRTLGQLGEDRGVTRERIRQLEALAKQRLRIAVANRHRLEPEQRLHPEVAAAFDALEALFARARARPMANRDFVPACHRALGVEAVALDGAARLLAQLADLTLMRFARGDMDPVWHDLEDELAPRVARQVEAIHVHLTREQVAPCTPAELVAGGNRHLAPLDHLTLDGVCQVAAMCGTVELTADGRFRGRLEALDGKAHMAARVLAEFGEPMHLSELALKLNRRLAGHLATPIRTANLSNHLSVDDRFRPIGRSGYWALAAWEQVETGAVLSLIERCLREQDGPLTPDEIHAYVAARRPVRRASVSIYLTDPTRFIRMRGDTYGLAHWRPDRPAIVADRQSVAERVAAQFAAAGTDRLPYERVRDALATALELSERRAGALLARNPVVRTETGPGGERLVVLEPDYPERLKAPLPRRRRKNTQTERITARARELLAATPGHRLRLTELRDRLMAEYDKPPHTIYAYIQRAADIETYQDSPGTRRRWARLRAPEAAG